MVAEIISTVERRRRWPDDEKLRILSEALVPGATAAAVADRNGVCRSLLYTWLRLAREGKLAGISMTRPPVGVFVPVRIEPSKLAPREENSLRGAAARIVGARGVILEFGSGSDAAWVAEICGRLL